MRTTMQKALPSAQDIRRAWDRWTGRFEAFARKLDREGVPYLSFSKIASLEFCPQRYLLEYVKRVRLRPEPGYFVKGRLLHEAAARVYRAAQRGRTPSLDGLRRRLDRCLSKEDARHVRNAIQLLVQGVDPRWEVVAVEEPFILDLGPELPPCLGIVDLMLRRGKRHLVVDHKGGKRFGTPDRLQLVLYREYARRQYGVETCATTFDQYRWVNNLDRVRKPAFCRTRVAIRGEAWNAAVRRMARRYRQMQLIEHEGTAPGSGDCMICPFRDQCPKAEVSFGGWWY